MTTEFDLIRRYRGAFTEDECNKFIDFIERFDKHNILIHDKENLHQVNHKTANVSFTYDFPAYSICLLYTSPSPRDRISSRMPSSA